MLSQFKASCKIENNILIGEEDPIDDKCINIGELILKAFKSRPDFIGQVDAKTGEENTFQQMRERSVKCALWLKKLGVGRGDIVTVYTSNHLDTYIPYLATLYIGAILAVWNESRTINLLHYLQSSTKVIFTDTDKASTIFILAKKLEIPMKIVVFKRDKETCKEGEKFESVESILDHNFDEDKINEFSCTELGSSRDIAVTLFSSSTAAYREHVAIPHAFFTSPSNQQTPIMLPNDVGLWFESLYWNISLLLTVRCILSYVKVVKINNSFNPSKSFEERFCDTIQKYKVTWVFLKIKMIRQFSRLEIFKKYDVSSLKQLLLGGRIPMNDVRRSLVIALPNTYVFQLYCLPEIGVITYQREFIMPNSSGYVSKNVCLSIADYITGSSVGPNRIGVICCKSPCVSNGYFNSMPGCIVPVTDEGGWLRTNDIGYYDPSGEIYVLERVQYVIRYRETYFLPADIENIIISHPEVVAAAVTPIFNFFDGQHPLAYVVLKDPESKITEEELIQYVEDNAVVDCLRLRAGLIFKHKLKYLKNGYLDRTILYKWAKDDLKDKIYLAKKNLKKLN